MGLRGSIGGSRYHTGTPSVKSYKLRVAKIDLLTIPDGRKRKRKRKMLIGNEPHCSLVTEVAAVAGETMEETSLMDHQ